MTVLLTEVWVFSFSELIVMVHLNH
jgi:hypothetical protein